MSTPTFAGNSSHTYFTACVLPDSEAQSTNHMDKYLFNTSSAWNPYVPLRNMWIQLVLLVNGFWSYVVYFFVLTTTICRKWFPLTKHMACVIVFVLHNSVRFHVLVFSIFKGFWLAINFRIQSKTQHPFTFNRPKGWNTGTRATGECAWIIFPLKS